MTKKNIIMIAVFLSTFLVTVQAYAKGATRLSGAIYANGQLYDTVVTPASFLSPPEHSTDTLYNFGMSGLKGQSLVSDSAPGDPTYNGGRWSVKVVVFTEDGVNELDSNEDEFIDIELTSAEEVLDMQELGYLEIFDTTTYFECPLLPHKN